MEEQIKIGFIIRGTSIPAWYFETIKIISKQKNIDLYFINITTKILIEQPKHSVFYKLFQKFEDWWFKSEFDVNKCIPVDSITSSIIKISNQDDIFLLDAEALNKLELIELDLIYTIDFSGESQENISWASKYGLWYVLFGVEKYAFNRPAAFWEVMNNNPVTGSYLLMRKSNVDTILYKASTRTVPYSVKNNLNSIAWKSSSFLQYRMMELIERGDTFNSRYKERLDKNKVANGFPSNASMLFLFFKNVIGYLFFKAKEKFKHGRFTLLYSFSQFDLENLNSFNFNVLPLPEGVFYADPFVIEKDGINYIFFEEFSYSKNKAHISIIEIGPDNIPGKPKNILEQPYHLSYPFIFLWQDVYYMVPETTSNKTVSLYKAANFPDKWEFVMHLIQGKELIDVTLHFDNNKWWMFANSSNHPFVSTNDQLFLYYSDQLFSADWKPHIQNPIATEAGNCRPAGRIFRHQGRLYRPAQNNSAQQYGYGLNFNEIEVLNDLEYKERLVHSIDISRLNLKACHQLDFSNSLIVIDGIPNKI